MYRRLAVLVAVALGALVVAACASSDDAGPPGSATVSPASPSGSAGPTGTPTEDAFIIYREASGALIAQHIMTGEKYHQEVDFTKEVIVGLQCVPDGSKIAYLKQEFSRTDRQLVIRGEGAPEEPLSLLSSTQSIAWSPDGTRMAVSDYDGFSQEHTLSIFDIATDTSTEIDHGTDFVGSVGWSPDGTRLAYYLQPVTNQGAQVYVLPLDDGEPQQITSGGDISWYDPVWSPDGSRIVVAGLQEEDFQLYGLDPDGGGEPVRITESDIFKRGPQFSPGGTLIGYTGSIVVPAVSAMALHSFGIFLMNSDGTNEHAFTADPRTNPGAQVDPYLDAYLMGFCAPGPWLDDLWVPEQ